MKRLMQSIHIQTATDRLSFNRNHRAVIEWFPIEGSVGPISSVLRAPGMDWIGLRSRSSRQQPCSAIINWPILASLGIRAMQARKVSWAAPAARSTSLVASVPGAIIAGSPL
jgi:hypothetical protein